MNKSHTTLIYAMKKLEDQLGVALLKVVGKRAELTKEGKTLLRYANSMLEQAENLEVMSGQLSKGTESEITVTIDHLCDKEILYLALQIFIKRNAVTSVQVIETSLTSTIESVTNQLSDIALINIPITNVPVEAIGLVSKIPVVSKNHPLAILAMKEPLTMGDFTNETQIVLRDLGSADKEQLQDDMNVGWLKAKRRITVDTFDVALQAVKNGLGFTRIPLYMYDKLENNDLVKLQVAGANCYQIPIHITLPKGVDSRPATLELYDLIIETARTQASNSNG
jgi:DNA-binding transcriptional LysR family regulator